MQAAGTNYNRDLEKIEMTTKSLAYKEDLESTARNAIRSSTALVEEGAPTLAVFTGAGDYTWLRVNEERHSNVCKGPPPGG